MNPKYEDIERPRLLPLARRVAGKARLRGARGSARGGGGSVKEAAAAERGLRDRLRLGLRREGRAESHAAQRRLADIARAARMPLLGPNCMGIVNHALGAGMTFIPEYVNMPRRRADRLRQPVGRARLLPRAGRRAGTRLPLLLLRGQFRGRGCLRPGRVPRWRIPDVPRHRLPVRGRCRAPHACCRRARARAARASRSWSTSSARARTARRRRARIPARWPARPRRTVPLFERAGFVDGRRDSKRWSSTPDSSPRPARRSRAASRCMAARAAPA